MAVVGKCEQHLEGTLGFDQVMGTELGEHAVIVGDCAAPWNIGLAIRTANFAARKI